MSEGRLQPVLQSDESPMKSRRLYLWKTGCNSQREAPNVMQRTTWFSILMMGVLAAPLQCCLPKILVQPSQCSHHSDEKPVSRACAMNQDATLATRNAAVTPVRIEASEAQLVSPDFHPKPSQYTRPSRFTSPPTTDLYTRTGALLI